MIVLLFVVVIVVVVVVVVVLLVLVVLVATLVLVLCVLWLLVKLHWWQHDPSILTLVSCNIMVWQHYDTNNDIHNNYNIIKAIITMVNKDKQSKPIMKASMIFII